MSAMGISSTKKTVGVVALLFAVLTVTGVGLFGRPAKRTGPPGMAVEFMDHAAAVFVALDKGWFKAQGLDLSVHESFSTGMALAAALSRGDIQVAYMCLIPAINAFANAGVPLRIVAGTHRYGYGLVVDPGKIARVEDLAKPEVQLGCVRQGGAVDVLMNRVIDEHGLDRKTLLGKVRRMSPSKLLIAIQTGQLDAVFLPEQWASLAEDRGFRMLLSAQDVWPGMQGSVLVVKQDLISEDPELVRGLVQVTHRATQWLNGHPEQAAHILVHALSVGEGKAASIPEKTMLRSMGRLEYTTTISKRTVQEAIDYAAALGYIQESFPADQILDERFVP